jgi:peptidyl-prolyl cis-trans isomerase SurA
MRVVLFAGALGVAVFAGKPEKLDGIVAVVDDEVILKSELDGYTAMRLSAMNVKPDSATITGYEKKFLDELIDGKVLLAHAKNDTTITLTDEEVDRALENQIEGILKQNHLTLDGLEAALEREQGMTLAKFKTEARISLREQLLKQKVQRQYIPSIKATRRDVEAFYAKYRDSLPKAGESVLLSRLAVTANAAPEVRQVAWDKITALKKRLDNGEEFAEVAKKYSEGPEADSGGDLGFIEKGSLNLVAFEEKAFSMEPGRISDPFETRLGFHIINVVARQNQQVHVRQIFVKVAPPPEEMTRITGLLDSIRRSCSTAAGFAAAVRRYGSDDASRVADGLLGWKSIITLDGPLRAAIDTLGKGSITPIVTEDKGYAVYRINDRVPERTLTLDDDWQVLADKTQDIMAQKKMIELVGRWRKQIYVSIRM